MLLDDSKTACVFTVGDLAFWVSFSGSLSLFSAQQKSGPAAILSSRLQVELLAAPFRSTILGCQLSSWRRLITSPIFSSVGGWDKESATVLRWPPCKL